MLAELQLTDDDGDQMVITKGYLHPKQKSKGEKMQMTEKYSYILNNLYSNASIKSLFFYTIAGLK